jgi:hypothetical protein
MVTIFSGNDFGLHLHLDLVIISSSLVIYLIIYTAIQLTDGCYGRSPSIPGIAISNPPEPLIEKFRGNFLVIIHCNLGALMKKLPRAGSGSGPIFPPLLQPTTAALFAPGNGRILIMEK